jgi:hypothetical protein
MALLLLDPDTTLHVSITTPDGTVLECMALKPGPATKTAHLPALDPHDTPSMETMQLAMAKTLSELLSQRYEVEDL